MSLMTMGLGLFTRQPLAAVLGAAALAGTLAAGVQSVRLAQAKSETAQAQLAFADFRNAQAAAALEQQRHDAELSARLIARQADRLASLHDQTLTSLRRLADAPVTRDCGPVMRDASRSLQQLFHGGARAAEPPAGSQPAAPVR